MLVQEDCKSLALSTVRSRSLSYKGQLSHLLARPSANGGPFEDLMGCGSGATLDCKEIFKF